MKYVVDVLQNKNQPFDNISAAKVALDRYRHRPGQPVVALFIDPQTTSEACWNTKKTRALIAVGINSTEYTVIGNISTETSYLADSINASQIQLAAIDIDALLSTAGPGCQYDSSNNNLQGPTARHFGWLGTQKSIDNNLIKRYNNTKWMLNPMSVQEAFEAILSGEITNTTTYVPTVSIEVSTDGSSYSSSKTIYVNDITSSSRVYVRVTVTNFALCPQASLLSVTVTGPSISNQNISGTSLSSNGTYTYAFSDIDDTGNYTWNASPKYNNVTSTSSDWCTLDITETQQEPEDEDEFYVTTLSALRQSTSDPSALSIIFSGKYGGNVGNNSITEVGIKIYDSQTSQTPLYTLTSPTIVSDWDLTQAGLLLNTTYYYEAYANVTTIGTVTGDRNHIKYTNNSTYNFSYNVTNGIVDSSSSANNTSYSGGDLLTFIVSEQSGYDFSSAVVTINNTSTTYNADEALLFYNTYSSYRIWGDTHIEVTYVVEESGDPATEFIVIAQASPANGGTARLSTSSITSTSQVTLTSPTAITFTATPAENYEFSGWTSNKGGSKSTPSFTETISSAITYTANFTSQGSPSDPITYTLILDPNSSNPGYSSGEQVTTTYSANNIPAQPTRPSTWSANTNYDFDGWSKSVDGSQVTSISTADFDSNDSLTLYARYKEIEQVVTHTVSASISNEYSFNNAGTVKVGNGSAASTSSDTVQDGGNIQLVAYPNSDDNFEFANWKYNNTIVSNTSTYTANNITEDREYIASFKKNDVFYIQNSNVEFTITGNRTDITSSTDPDAHTAPTHDSDEIIRYANIKVGDSGNGRIFIHESYGTITGVYLWDALNSKWSNIEIGPEEVSAPTGYSDYKVYKVQDSQKAKCNTCIKIKKKTN